VKVRFILSTGKTTPEQEKEFVKLMESNTMNWWHWLPNTWLIVGNFGTSDKTKVLNIAMQAFPNVNLMVFDIPEQSTNSWAGLGPQDKNDSKKDMFNWLHNFWRNP
jgi:hypothetical protein